ncbi:MAG: hypothetical protein Aureis2KO_30190 [Aureisphaera sp.]
MYFTYAKGLCSKNSLTTLTLLILFSTISFAQDCGVTLEVDKGRNSRSVDEDGTQFVLVLTNTSSSSETFNISTSLIQDGCSNGKRALQSSAVLDLSIVDMQYKGKSASKISLGAKQTRKFMVDVKAPVGTPHSQWGCYEVKAVSNDCTASTVLKIYVPDSSEE